MLAPFRSSSFRFFERQFLMSLYSYFAFSFNSARSFPLHGLASGEQTGSAP